MSESNLFISVSESLAVVGNDKHSLMFVVPLFKMTSRRTEPGKDDDDYLVPHWINLSFYTTNRKIGYSAFIPRIKLPPLKCATLEEAKVTCYFPARLTESQPPESPFTYDEYDAKVFEMPGTKPRGLHNCRKNLTGSSSNISSPKKDPREASERGLKIPSKDDSSVSDFHSRSVSPRKMSSAITIPSHGGAHHDTTNLDQYSKTFSGQLKTSRKIGMCERGVRGEVTVRQTEADEPEKPVWGSAGAGSDIKHHHLLFRPGRALVNPFDPRNVPIKRSSNRRRWTHIFPQLPHSVQDKQAALPSLGSEASGPTCHHVENSLSRIADSTVGERSRAGGGEERDTRLGSLMWGVTGDLPWDATLITGVDWRSITWPACLPITTDYFPDKRAFDNDYVVNQYVIIPDEINSDYASRSSLQKAALTTREVFMELICQRLSQGFQLIINPNRDEMMTSSSKSLGTNISNQSLFGGSKSSVTINNMNKTLMVSEHFWLSIGKNFHHLSLTGNKIDVIIYRPKHPYPALDYHYIYRFMAPDNDTYEVSWVEFNMEKLENYSWNYLDHYVTTRGDHEDYKLSENLKYWRFRMYILPLKPFVPYTSIIRDGPQGGRCDLYKKPGPDEYVNLAEGFMRFIETSMNKIKRSVSNVTDRRKSRCNTLGVGDLKAGPPLRVFRERVGSSSSGQARQVRDRVVSGPVTETLRKRTESGGAGASASVRLREREVTDPGVRPLIQTISTVDIGSEDSVFSLGHGVSSMESQVGSDLQ